MSWIRFFSEIFRLKYGGDSLSLEFEHHIESQIGDRVKDITGIDVFNSNGKIIFSSNSKYISFELGREDEIKCAISVFPDFSFPVRIAWYSKNGKKYLPSSKDIDRNDIVFNLLDFDAKGFMAAFYKKPPFLKLNLKKYIFPVEIDYLVSSGIYLRIICKNGCHDELKESLENIFVTWNKKIESNKKSKERLVHDFGMINQTDSDITFFIDLGFASIKFIRELLDALITKNRIELVRLTSFPDPAG